MGLLEECYDVLRDNKDAKILLDDLGLRVAEDWGLLDEEDLYPHARMHMQPTATSTFA